MALGDILQTYGQVPLGRFFEPTKIPSRTALRPKKQQICQKKIIGVDISRTGRGIHDEAKFRLESSQGLSGIQEQRETMREDIMGAIKVI